MQDPTDTSAASVAGGIEEGTTFSGVLPRLLRKSLTKTLDRTLGNVLDHLEVDAERRHSHSRA